MTDAKDQKKTEKAPKVMPKCLCGCGEQTKGGRFIPGHDAKLKSDLFAKGDNGDKAAIAKLNELGWGELWINHQRVVKEKAERAERVAAEQADRKKAADDRRADRAKKAEERKAAKKDGKSSGSKKDIATKPAENMIDFESLKEGDKVRFPIGRSRVEGTVTGKMVRPDGVDIVAIQHESKTFNVDALQVSKA